MELEVIDLLIMFVFFAFVIFLGLSKSRKEKTSEDYFLAGRGLNWVLIGFSLIAANISAEQFVGMSGQAARGSIGLAVASYEWIAAITLVVVACFFLPKFLKAGIFTIPEYLEYRFNHSARLIMSLLMVVIYVGVTISTVIFLGAKALEPLFSGQLLGINFTITTLAWIVGIVAAVYVAAGGLKACAWADLIQGSALIAGGAVIMILAFMALDNPAQFEGIDGDQVARSLGVGTNASLGEKFAVLKKEKMHMVLPAASDFLPWTALLLGIWIPNFYYWGLNQFILQRALGARALSEGQKGVVFAAFLKLIVPFIVCIPGIIAFTLYAPKMRHNAMNDPTLNKPVLESFEELRQKPEIANTVFPFDSDFARLHPKLARDILEFNSKVLEQNAPEGEDLAKRNTALFKNARKKQPEEFEQLVVKQKLTGYDYDGAFPLLIRYLAPAGLRGFVLAALMGAVISSLASMLNAASTIFTMDIYREWFHKQATQKVQVWVGRLCVLIFVVIGCLIAPQLASPKFKGAFAFIQEFQGFVSPGVLSIFLFGLFVKRSPRFCGVLGLLLNPFIYGFLYIFWRDDLSFLDRMAITVGVIVAVLSWATLLRPLRQPVTLPSQTKISMNWSKGAIWFGGFVCLLTVLLYVIFW